MNNANLLSKKSIFTQQYKKVYELIKIILSLQVSWDEFY